MTIFGRHIHFYTLFYQRFLFQTVGNEVTDSDNLDAEFLGFLDELRHASHSSVFVHYFNQGATWLQTCQTSQIYGCFCMSGTLQYTFVLCIKRIDMSWASECRWGRGWVGQGTDSSGTVVDGYTCRASFQLVYGNGKRSSQNGCIVSYLFRKV